MTVDRSDIGKKDVVSTLVPIVFLSIVVGPRARGRPLGVFETGLPALKHAVVL